MHNRTALFTLGVVLACTLSGCQKGASTKAPAAKWTMKIGRARHPLALGIDGTIYALLDTGVLMAIDPGGKVAWTQQAAPSNKVALGPAVGADGGIYVASLGYLSIFDHNGTLRTNMKLFTFGTAYGMAITDDRLYTQCMRQGVCAFSLGIMGPTWLWHVSEDGAAPIVLPNGTVVFGHESLVAIENVPQLPLWIYPQGGSMTPDGDHADWYDISPMGNARWSVTALSAASDGTIYVNRANALTALDASGHLKWELSAHPFQTREAVLAADGTIYLPFEDGHLYAVRADGRVLWKSELAGVPGQALVGSSGTIFFMDGRTLRAVGPDGRDKWSTDLDSNILMYNADSIPTLGDDGTFYIASREGTLYAFPVGESLMSSAWPKFQANVRNSGQVNQ